MNAQAKKKLVVGIQLAVVAFYIFHAVKAEAQAPVRDRIKLQKKTMKAARKQAVKQLKKEAKQK